MIKLISRTVFVVLATTGLGSPALAQVPGGGGEVLCQTVVGPLVTDQDGGAFPVGPVGCDIDPWSEASISVQPFGVLSASVNAANLDPVADGSAAVALAALQYDFTLTGGHVGDLVPVLVLSGMQTVATGSAPAASKTATGTFRSFATDS